MPVNRFTRLTRSTLPRVARLPVWGGRGLLAAAGLAGLLGLGACSPSLNWREVPVAGGQVVALFPCKPDQHTRQLGLAGATREVTLLSCAAEGNMYALSHTDPQDPTQVGPVLAGLHAALAANLGGQLVVGAGGGVAGTTPHPLAQRVAVTGQRADGQVLKAQAQFFVLGTRVYQATVMGPAPVVESVDSFLDGLRLAR